MRCRTERAITLLPSLSQLGLAILAAGLALASTPLVRRAARRAGAVDLPGGRRVHHGVVPRLGGIAVLAAGGGALLIGWMIGAAALPPLLAHGWRLLWLAAGTLTIVIVRAIAALHDVGPLPKLAWQLVAGILALVGGYGFAAVTNPFSGGYFEFGALGGVMTV